MRLSNTATVTITNSDPDPALPQPRCLWGWTTLLYPSAKALARAHGHVSKHVFKPKDILFLKEATIGKIKGCYDNTQP